MWARTQGSSDAQRCIEGASYDAYAEACYCDPGYSGDPELACEPPTALLSGATALVGREAHADKFDETLDFSVHARASTLRTDGLRLRSGDVIRGRVGTCSSHSTEHTLGHGRAFRCFCDHEISVVSTGFS